MSALKNNVKRGRYPVIKNPSRDKVKCGRSDETKLWETHQGYMRSHYISWLTSVLTLLPSLRQLLKDLSHFFKLCRTRYTFSSIADAHIVLTNILSP